MEPVVTLGQDPDSLPEREIRETDGTLRAGSVELEPGRVDQGGQGSEGLPPEPGLGEPGHRVRVGFGLDRHVRAPERAPDDGIETQRTYQSAEEDGEDHDDVGIKATPRRAGIRLGTGRTGQ